MKLKLSYIICAVLVPLVMMITLALLVSVLQFKQDVALSAKPYYVLVKMSQLLRGGSPGKP